MKTMRLLLCLATLSLCPLAQPKEANPDDAYGLKTLPTLWSAGEYSRTLAACGSAAALYLITKNNPLSATQTLVATLALGSCGWLGANVTEPQRHWWQWDGLAAADRLKPEKLKFPAKFMFGTGTSSYQVEGVGENNGGDDTSTYAPEYRVTPTTPLGLACDQWNKYESDAKLMQDKGFTTYRFSVERFKVEPQQNKFSPKALKHYAKMARTLVQHNVRPLVGMHHYTDPQWFMNAGGFENEENLDGFANYCRMVTQFIYEACMQEINKDYEKRKHLIPLFYTYNSSNAYAIQGYQQGSKPPYVKSIQRFANVLGNMLDAHVRAYKAMKLVAPLSKIGTTINVYQLDPDAYRNPIHRLKCFFGNHMTHDAIFNFFRDGVFKLWLPTQVYTYKAVPDAPQCLDWVGLNYYSHGYMKTAGGPFSKPEDGGAETETTKENHPIYGEGLYRALHQVNDRVAAPLKIPIIITETGIGAGDDTDKRRRYLERYLYAASQACQAGIPLAGIMIWSFMDNYEWGTYTKRYGLFSVDFATQTRTWRPGAQHYADVIKRHQKDPDMSPVTL